MADPKDKRPKVKIYNPISRTQEEYNARPDDNTMVESMQEFSRTGSGSEGVANVMRLENERKKWKSGR